MIGILVAACTETLCRRRPFLTPPNSKESPTPVRPNAPIRIELLLSSYISITMISAGATSLICASGGVIRRSSERMVGCVVMMGAGGQRPLFVDEQMALNYWLNHNFLCTAVDRRKIGGVASIKRPKETPTSGESVTDKILETKMPNNNSRVPHNALDFLQPILHNASRLLSVGQEFFQWQFHALQPRERIPFAF